VDGRGRALPQARDRRLGAVQEPVAPEGGLDLRDHVVVLDVAGHRDHDRRGSVVRAVELRHLVTGHRGDGLDGPGDRTSERGVLPEGLGREQVVHHVVGVVVVHRDLVEDDVALGVDVLGGDQGVGDHVAEHVHRQVQVHVEDPCVEAGVLLGGEGVELAADGVQGHRDVHRRAAPRALEQHVLEEVGAAVQRLVLVGGPDPDPDPDAGRAHPGHLLGDDAQPRGEQRAAYDGGDQPVVVGRLRQGRRRGGGGARAHAGLAPVCPWR